MAGEALATMNCTSCGKPGAAVKKTKNSPLLYLHCSCGCNRSSAEVFQKKLRDAVSGIPEAVSENIPENSEIDPGHWKPTIATQTAKTLEIPETNNQPATGTETAPKSKSLKKIAGFTLFALGAVGFAMKALR